MSTSPPPNRPWLRNLNPVWQSSTSTHGEASEALRESPLELFPQGHNGPTYIEAGRVVVAGALREGARLWARAFQDARLGPGDRLILSARPGPGFLHVLAAALGRRMTLALVPAGADLDAMLEQFDAKVAIGEGARSVAWVPGPAGEPPVGRPPSRRTIGPPTPSARLLLATSGTTGPPRWVALSDRNLRSVLSGHGPILGLDGARVLSVLPWTHAFGLIIDLIPALMAGAAVVRDPGGGRDPRAMADLFRRHRVTHLSAVPLVYRRLVENCGDHSPLRGLRGGVVGGAPVTPLLAAMLADTRLRVGYGLTEASPGLALGRPGVWAPYCLGRPVGCRVRLDREGGLQFRGPNACMGLWSDRGLERLDPDRWVETGDLVDLRGDELFYRGRSDDCFKLENGRWIDAGVCEGKLRRQLPAIDEVLLFTPDGDQLAIAWSGDRSGTPPDTASLREALGSPGAVLRWAIRVPEETWSRTAKGSIDRRATEGRLKDLIQLSERRLS